MDLAWRKSERTPAAPSASARPSLRLLLLSPRRPTMGTTAPRSLCELLDPSLVMVGECSVGALPAHSSVA